MVEKILQMLSLSCSHKKVSQPFTAAAVSTGVRAGSADWERVSAGPSHYVVCLECGKKFSYDWQHMRVLR